MKVIQTLLIDQIKLIELDGKVVNYVFNIYIRGDDGYKLWVMKHGGSKFTNCGCITFNESWKNRKSKYMKMKILETMAGNTQFEDEVSVMDTSSSEWTITKASNYYLTCDKVRIELYLLKGTIMWLSYLCFECGWIVIDSETETFT